MLLHVLLYSHSYNKLWKIHYSDNKKSAFHLHVMSLGCLGIKIN
jgi:hypothetical protein